MIPITLHHAGLWYASFYILAILAAAAIQFSEGRKRNYPIISWILVIVLGKLFFVTGSKVITYANSDWSKIIQTFCFPDNDARSVLGGFVAFVLVYIIARYYLRYSNHFLDTLTVPLLVSMAVQRVGCLIVGCCGGTVCNLPWAIHYLPNSLVYNSQQTLGLINSSAAYSLPIHPVQLYHIIAILFILLLHFKLKKYWKAPGNSLLFAGVAYLFFRFLFEFVLDPATSSITVNYAFGLKIVQWAILFIGVIVSLLIIYRERQLVKVFRDEQIPKDNSFRNMLLISILIAIIWIARNWFSFYELVVLAAILFGLFIVLAVKLNAKISIASYRWIPLAMGLCFFVLTGQTLVMKPDSAKKNYHTIGISAVMGEYETKHSSGCSSEIFKQKTNLIAIGYSYNQELKKSQLEYGLSVVIGDNQAVSSNYTNDFSNNGQPSYYNNKKYQNDIFGFVPFLYWNKKYIGLGGSLGIGKFTYGNQPFTDQFMPGFEFRLGRRDLLYLKSSVLYNSPEGSNLPLASVMVATGFGFYNGNHFGIGLANNGYGDRFGILMEGSYLLLNKYDFYTSFNLSGMSDQIYSFGLRYRIYK